MKYLLITLVLASCSSAPKDPFKPYVEKFERETNKPTTGVSVSFSHIQPEAVGLCYPESKTVKIDLKAWVSYDEDTREALLYHELGHCALNLKHIEDGVDAPGYGSIPASLMSPTVVPGKIFKHYRSLFIKALLENRPISHEEIVAFHKVTSAPVLEPVKDDEEQK